MTERTDLTTRWGLSPRIVEMSSATPEPRQISIQDLHDTLKSNTKQAGENDDSLDNVDDDPLIDSAGKEDLGDGVLVGITSTFTSAKFAFIPDTTPDETGTVTTPNAAGTNLIDSAATFVTNLIEPGAWVINWTDRSISSVIQVLSETELEMFALEQGTDNQWDSADAYSVWNVEQCEINGGNLVGVDDLGDPASPVLPTALTQIVRTASSSATLQESAAIEFASFNGGVTVDILSPFSGTTFPTGTQQQPVNNMTDAQSILTERGLNRYFIIGDLTLASGIFTGNLFEGESEGKSTITLNPAATLANCEFRFATITGTLDGGSLIENAHVIDLNFVDGHLHQCLLDGTITLSGLQNAHIIDCWSGVIGGATPIIDMGGSGSGLGLRNYNGGIQINNLTAVESVSADLNSAHLILDSTVTAGNFLVRGVGTITDNSTSVTSLDTTGFIDGQDMDLLAYDGMIHIDAISGDDANDGKPATPVQTAAAAKTLADSLGITGYSFKGSITLTTAHDKWSFKGQSAGFNDVVNLNNQSVDESLFEGCQLAGDATESGVECFLCELDNPGNLWGLFRECGLLNTFKIEATAPQTYVFHLCYSQIAGSGRPTLDFTNSLVTHNVQFRNYTGGLSVTNCDNGNLSVDAVGTVDLKSTVAGGDIVVRGVGNLINSAVGGTIDTNGFVRGLDVKLIKAIDANRAVITGSNPFVIQIFDEDDVTVLRTLEVTADGRTRTVV